MMCFRLNRSQHMIFIKEAKIQNLDDTAKTNLANDGGLN